MAMSGIRLRNLVLVAYGVLSLLLLVSTSVLAEETDIYQLIDDVEARVQKLEEEENDLDAENKIKVGGIMSGVFQGQKLKSPYNIDDGEHGAIVLQPEVDISLTEQDTLFVKFGFAAGNGMNGNSPFALAPWAAPMEDDVKDINGRNRDYLLTAWYAHSIEFGEDGVLELSAGIIDATDYLDQNTFSNDEHTQFMNEALVNAANSFFPSFDLGGAVVLNSGNFEIAVVGMNITENNDGNGYNFYRAEFEYELKTPIGNGVYRIIPCYTTAAFLDPTGSNKESRFLLLFSFDQKFGENFGAWTRFGFQDDKASVPYSRLISGGIDLSGGIWGRYNDNIGLGYAYLDDGNETLESSHVLEIYYRYAANDFLALSLDAQYLIDKYFVGDGPTGYLLGVRGTIEF